jgi:hypothetical protein
MQYETLNPDDRRPGKLLSIVLPAYNEQDVLQMTYDRFTAALPGVCR